MDEDDRTKKEEQKGRVRIELRETEREWVILCVFVVCLSEDRKSFRGSPRQHGVQKMVGHQTLPPF